MVVPVENFFDNDSLLGLKLQTIKYDETFVAKVGIHLRKKYNIKDKKYKH